MILVGFTALSVDIKINFLVLYLSTIFTTFNVPKTLFLNA